MQKTKMMLLAVLVAALAVPSLWAQKEDSLAGRSITQIKTQLQKQAQNTGVPAVCTASVGGIGPSGYLAGTNKCSSSSPLYGFGNSINATVNTCANKGGVQGTWSTGMTVFQAGVPGSVYTSWGSSNNVGGFEYAFPDVYTTAISPSPDITLSLGNKKQSVFGLEFSNPTQELYDVTVLTDAGDISLSVTAGGVSQPFNEAQRVVAICNTPAITGVTLSCVGCADDAQTAVGQVRGDKFPGF